MRESFAGGLMHHINWGRRLGAWVTVAFAAALLWVFMMPSYRQGEPSLAGKAADDFAVNVAGRARRLSDFRGKLVVLNFWASWCRSCVEEIPDLDRLQERIRSRGGVVLGVSVDENCASYDRFLQRHPVAFQTVCDPTNENVMHGYGTVAIPETYVIDRKGRIDRKIIGPQQWESAEMMAYFDAALAR
jgi:cytochrome c biogenesis protein CcmG, thiol:disulfide interchange protein DsbE